MTGAVGTSVRIFPPVWSCVRTQEEPLSVAADLGKEVALLEPLKMPKNGTSHAPKASRHRTSAPSNARRTRIDGSPDNHV